MENQYKYTPKLQKKFPQHYEHIPPHIVALYCGSAHHAEILHSALIPPQSFAILTLALLRFPLLPTCQAHTMHDEKQGREQSPCREQSSLRASPHITRVYTAARSFEKNIMIALGELPGDTTPLHRIDDEPKQRKPRRQYERQCAYDNCAVWFRTEHPRLRYHTKQCRDHANDAKYRRNKKQNPAKYAAMKRAKNIQWARYAYGITNSPPVQPGKPTQVKKQDLREFREKLKRIAEDARWTRKGAENGNRNDYQTSTNRED